MKTKQRSRLQWFELTPCRRVRGGAHLSNKSKTRLVALLQNGVPLEQIPAILHSELKEDPERVERYITGVQSRLKNQKKPRRDPDQAPPDIAALMRWSAVIQKEQRRKNVSHPPNSSPVVRAFLNKADQITGAGSSVRDGEDSTGHGAAGGGPSCQGGNSSGGGDEPNPRNAMNFTLANMYRYIALASETYEPPCTELMAALLRFFTERLVTRLQIAQQGPDGRCIEELTRLLTSKGEAIANLQIRASDRVYWSGQGRPPPGWDPKAYTDAIYNAQHESSDLSASNDGQREEGDDGPSAEGSTVPTGGLLSRAAAVANLLQLPTTLLRRVHDVMTMAVPPPTAYPGRRDESAGGGIELVENSESGEQQEMARIDEVMELVHEYKHHHGDGGQSHDYNETQRTSGDVYDIVNEDQYDDDVVLVRVE